MDIKKKRTKKRCLLPLGLCIIVGDIIKICLKTLVCVHNNTTLHSHVLCHLKHGFLRWNAVRPRAETREANRPSGKVQHPMIDAWGIRIIR